MLSSRVQSTLDKGRIINVGRCQKKQETVDHQKTHSENLPHDKPFHIYKISFPAQPKYPSCKHHKGVVLDRNLLTSTEHLKLLASPKKNFVKPYPMWVKKKIAPSTSRINDLASPNVFQILNTFEHHLKHLSIFQIESFLQQIFKDNHQTPEIILLTIKQKIRERHARMQQQRRKMRKLRARLDDERMQSVKSFSNYVAKCFRPYVLNCNRNELSSVSQNDSNTIMVQICQLLKRKLPIRNSCDFFDQLLVRIADKMAWWMANFIENGDFKSIEKILIDESRCAKEFSMDCYPIEDYFPHGDAIEVEETERNSVKSANSEEVIRTEEVPDGVTEQTKPKLSFLRKSQIQIDQNDCQNLFEKIRQFQKEKSENKNQLSTENEEKKKLRKEKLKGKLSAEKNTADAAISRTRKLPAEIIEKTRAEAGELNSSTSKNHIKNHMKTVESKGIISEGQKDVIKKPQWEIEWIDKMDFAADQTHFQSPSTP